MNTIQMKVPHGIDSETQNHLRSQLSPVEHRIVQDLYQIAVDAFMLKQTSDTYWTGNIKKALESHSKQLDLLCCHSDHIGEWLFDVSWLETSAPADKTENWKEAKRLVMACESEWGENEDKILWDFLKLSWSNAELRVFIYTNHMKHGAVDHPTDLCRRFCPPSKGARFILIGFPKRPENGETFRVDSWKT